MSRKTIYYTVPPGSPSPDGVALPTRDTGKVFLITEKSARDAEEWGTRAMLALQRLMGDSAPAAAGLGLAGVAAVGVNVLVTLQYAELKPIMDEMLDCIQWVNPQQRSVMRPLNWDADDVEEVSTLIQLRREVLTLHLGFSLAVLLSRWQAARQTLGGNPSNAQTSQDLLQP